MKVATLLVLFFFFNFSLFLNFTILYWFCHISKWIRNSSLYLFSLKLFYLLPFFGLYSFLTCANQELTKDFRVTLCPCPEFYQWSSPVSRICLQNMICLGLSESQTVFPQLKETVRLWLGPRSLSCGQCVPQVLCWVTCRAYLVCFPSLRLTILPNSCPVSENCWSPI